MPGQRLCRCLSLLLRPLCRSADQSRAKPAEALDGCRAILSRSRCCRLGGADPRSCRSGQTARVGRAAEGAPKGKPRLRGAVSARTGRLCRVNGSAGASLSSCGLCAALPISPGRSLRSPETGAGQSCPGPGAVGSAGPILGPAGQARRHGWVEPPKAPRRGKPRLRGAVSARTGRLCRVNALPVPLSPAAASVPLCRSVQGEACGKP